MAACLKKQRLLQLPQANAGGGGRLNHLHRAAELLQLHALRQQLPLYTVHVHLQHNNGNAGS